MEGGCPRRKISRDSAHVCDGVPSRVWHQCAKYIARMNGELWFPSRIKESRKLAKNSYNCFALAPGLDKPIV
eukprot:5926208-Heterocapsa_arctica.AAC.1